jgi:hypothetical protein
VDAELSLFRALNVAPFRIDRLTRATFHVETDCIRSSRLHRSAAPRPAHNPLMNNNTGGNTIVATIQSGAEAITKRERGTLVLVKHEGSWKVFHEHFSAAE